MTNKIKTGFFTMATITEICNQKDLNVAKDIAYKAIECYNANPNNKLKATSAVDKATSIPKLGIALTNFLLSHPSENLKVIK